MKKSYPSQTSLLSKKDLRDCLMLFSVRNTGNGGTQEDPLTTPQFEKHLTEALTKKNYLLANQLIEKAKIKETELS